MLKKGLEIRQDENGLWNLYDSKGDIFKDPSRSREELMAKISNDDMLVKEDVYSSSHYDEPNILAHVRFNDKKILTVIKCCSLKRSNLIGTKKEERTCIDQRTMHLRSLFLIF